MTAEIQIDAISDGSAQVRVEMSDQTVIDYAEEMDGGAIFPPVVVYFDGTDHWLAEGYHRVEAARKIGRDSIAAEVHEGTKRDAILLGIGANATHGLRRTQADKWRAVEILLRDDEWSKLSDRQIAKRAKVDHKTVGKIRREMSGGEIPSDRPGLLNARQDTKGRAVPVAKKPRETSVAGPTPIGQDGDLEHDEEPAVEADEEHTEPPMFPPPQRRKSRPARWADAVSRAVEALEELQDLQAEYQEWFDGLPDNLQDTPVAEKLAGVTETDIESALEVVREAEDADLPMGFGRD